MKAATLASRAILAEYARKTLRPVEVIAIIMFVIMVLGTTVLIMQVSSWWWILMILVIGYGVIGSIVWLIIHFTIDRLRPSQTISQEKAVKNFIKRIDSVADIIGITKFGLLLRIMRDVLSRGNTVILTDAIHDSTELAKEFKIVIAAFQDAYSKKE